MKVSQCSKAFLLLCEPITISPILQCSPTPFGSNLGYSLQAADKP